MENEKYGKPITIRLNEIELRKVKEWAEMRDLEPISVGKLLKRIILNVASNYEDDGFDFIINKRNIELKQTIDRYEAVMNDIQREAENTWVSMKNIAHMSQSLPNPRKIGEKE